MAKFAKNSIMKIGILGSGIVGRTLGTAFLKEGYEVMLGTRDISKPAVQEWLTDNSDAKVGLFKDCASFGEILVLATSGKGTLDMIQLAEPSNFSDKVIIDATNPIDTSSPEQGVMKFFTNTHNSFLEELQKNLPEAKLVKAFNSVGSALMYQPDFDGIKPTMFICGNNAEAKLQVSKILEQFGWEAEDMGSAVSARAIEPLCILWCIPGFLHNQWSHAFKLLKK